MIEIRELRGHAALTWLETTWPRIYAADPHATPYQSARWLGAWADQLPPGATPLLLVATDKGHPCGALALVDDERAGARSIYALSTPQAEIIRAVSPRADDPAVSEGLANHLAHLATDGTSLTLADLPTPSRLGSDLTARADWTTSTTRCANVLLPLDVAAMPKSLRRQHHNRERRLQGQHVTYARTSTDAGLLAAYPDLDDLHRARRTTLPGQFAAVLRRCGAETAFIATLTINGTLAAAQLCLYRGQHAYSLLPAMNPSLTALAPGHLLLRRLMADLATSGFTALDLGRTINTPGQIGYKDQYSPQWSDSLTVAAAVKEPALLSTR